MVSALTCIPACASKSGMRQDQLYAARQVTAHPRVIRAARFSLKAHHPVDAIGRVVSAILRVMQVIGMRADLDSAAVHHLPQLIPGHIVPCGIGVPFLPDIMRNNRNRGFHTGVLQHRISIIIVGAVAIVEGYHHRLVRQLHFPFPNIDQVRRQQRRIAELL